MAFNLQDIVEWEWSQFVKQYRSNDHSEYEDTLLEVVWAISDPKTSLASIRRVIDRVDGKQARVMEFVPVGDNGVEVRERVPPTTAIRMMIAEIAGRKKGTAQMLLDYVKTITEDPFSKHQADPKVKSVIAAALIVLSKTKQGAMDELLDQIDGKVTERIQVGGIITIENIVHQLEAGDDRRTD